jgi:hypothetical protein
LFLALVWWNRNDIYAIHTQTSTGFDALDCSPRMVAVIVNIQCTWNL